jgi:hypothetical protein
MHPFFCSADQLADTLDTMTDMRFRVFYVVYRVEALLTGTRTQDGHRGKAVEALRQRHISGNYL